mgnify:CR=1 FL=1
MARRLTRFKVSPDTPRNKIQTIIDQRELDGLGEELEQRWNGVGFSEHSTRELADFFNQKLLRESITSSGSVSLDGEVENIYSLLTDEDTQPGNLVQARNRLSEYGLDAEALEDEFISHQTMYRYLRDVRNVNTSTPEKSLEELLTATRQSLQRLNSRTQSVVASNVDKLAKHDGFDVSDYDVLVNVQLTCNACGSTYEITQFIEQQGCDCGTQ